MQIPKNLPQFENRPALFVASGEYEAKFYLALNGALDLKAEIKMPPREEAREKQAFVGIKSGRYGLAAVSHHGAYVEDLKKKFARKIHTAIHNLLAEYKPQEIYFFAPRYVADRAIEKLDQAERKKVKMIINKELARISPLVMIKMFWQESQSAIASKTELKNEEKKILARQKKKIIFLSQN